MNGPRVVALAGGVGGAKLATGLQQILPSGALTVIVNTGDDFEHWGLTVCPDLDTVMYNLAGVQNPETGWGRSGESWDVFDKVAQLGGPDWFRIGDKDLATHLERTRRLDSGEPLSEIVRNFCSSWEIQPTIIPMTDQVVSTIVNTLEMGELSFQEYFVHQHCEPTVKGFRFSGIEVARPVKRALESIAEATAIILCPSNPWVSIDPILEIPGIRHAIKNKKVIAISPIIDGKTVKGPAAKMFTELGIEPSSFAVAKHYQGTISGFILDSQDAFLEKNIRAMGIETLVANTLMKSSSDRFQLAQDVLNFIKKE